VSLNADNVVIAVTGDVAFAVPGSTLPINSTDPLPGAFRSVGYISEDGITESYDEDSETIQAWQFGTIVRRITSGSSAQFEFTMIETNKNSLETYYKNSTITGSGPYTLKVRPPGSDIKPYTFLVVDGDKAERIVLPTAEVTERGEVVRVSTDAVGYPVTITAYPITDPDDSTKQIVAYKYSDDTAWGVS
jgi:hypothetical protein